MKFLFRKIRLIFDFKNWLWKYNFGIFWRTIIHRRILKKQFSLSMLILRQKSCILGPTIFEIPQPNWHYSIYDCGQKIVGWYLCEVKFQHTNFNSVIEKSPDTYIFFLHWQISLESKYKSCRKVSECVSFF